MRLILRGIEKQKGNVADKPALLKALQAVNLSDSPRGPVKLDAYNAAIENVYIRQVTAAQDGSLYNKGLFTVKDVTQFGPYDAKVYMKQPPDGRTSPPDQHTGMAPEMVNVAREYQYVPFGQ
jgi:branched-chain amino acid transport system substrate-binding protein